ncbi:MAG: RNA-binding protein [Amphibacillus sp.]|nr:RNA-binding protein [Amphibacillus sp.]
MGIYQHFRKDEAPFIDQVLSWKDQVEKQYITKYSDFLDPREQYIFQNIIGQDEQFKLVFFGGIPNAERKQAILAPFYEEIDSNSFPISVLTTKYPAKFVTIEHRDVLGAFLSLGLLRKKLGDLSIDPDQGIIQLIVSADISDFIIAQFNSIKNANVQFQPIPLSKAIDSKDEWSNHETTVSSLRLDVMIKHIYRFSRTQALELIKKGYVKVNFKTVEDPAFIVESGDMISCRGKGRSRFNDIITQTKKQNYRISYALLKS